MSSWSPASSGASDSSSTTSGGDNERLTVEDIEEWHNQTTNIQSSFDTETSTLENNTIGTNEEIALGETEGSLSSSLSPARSSPLAGSLSAAGSGDGNDKAADNNRNRSTRQVVAGLPWRDEDGNEGMYTGEVNDDNVPDGLGLIRYNNEGGDDETKQQQQQEGEWNNGTLIRKKGIQHNDPNALSTIEEEKSVKAPSIKYSDEFANFLAAKQIGIENNTSQHSQSSNSMDANTTGDHSNGRDFTNSELFSSTSTSHLYTSTNSRKSHVYSSTNSRPTSAEFVSSTLSSTPEQQQQQAMPEQQQQSTTKRSQNETTETSLQQHHHEELGLVAVEEEEHGTDGSYRSGSYRSGSYSGRGDNANDDYYDEDQPSPHDTIDARKNTRKKLMVDDSESDSEEDYDGHANDDIASSVMYNWHMEPQEKSSASLFPIEDSDDDGMRPSLDTHLQSVQEQQKENKGQQKSFRSLASLGSYKVDDDLDGNIGSKFRSRKWCYLFSACCVLSMVGIGLICWAIVRNNNTNNNAPNSQSKVKDDSADAKVSLSWEIDAPCAYITIDIATDQYGNETTWILYHLSEVNNETSLVQATRASPTEFGHRNRLRPGPSSESNRKLEETTTESQVRSGGPYTYTSVAGADYTSPLHTSSVCLREGNYKFLISDVNGICCQHGLGQYSIYFNDGRTVRSAPGVFQEKEITLFEVTRDDILAALVTASPSQSLSPSTTSSPSLSLSPTVSCCVRVHLEDVCLNILTDFFLFCSSSDHSKLGA